ASRLPSGLQATLETKPVSPHRVSKTFPLAASQTSVVWCPITSRLPSGLQDTSETKSLSRRRVINTCPLAASHTLATPAGTSSPFQSPSQLAVATRLPSGLHATVFTWPL